VESALIEEYVSWNVMYIMTEHGFGGIWATLWDTTLVEAFTMG